MILPELKIIGKDLNHNENTATEYLTVELNWDEMENYKITSRKNWYKQYANVKDKETLDIVLNNINWHDGFFYPTEFTEFFKMYSKFKMPINYYNECSYLKNSAITEWNREKRFDTIVREALLEPAIAYIESYFHIICDSIFMYNLQLFKKDEKALQQRTIRDKYKLITLLLFRLWKHQTGSGLILNHSFKYASDELIQELRPILNKNINYDILNLCDINSLVEQEKRNQKLIKILK